MLLPTLVLSYQFFCYFHLLKFNCVFIVKHLHFIRKREIRFINSPDPGPEGNHFIRSLSAGETACLQLKTRLLQVLCIK